MSAIHAKFRIRFDNVVATLRLIATHCCFLPALILAAVSARAEDAGSIEKTAIVTSKPDNPGLHLEEIFTAGDTRFRHSATVTSIALTPDRRHVITAARDATARLWDMESGREIRRYYHPGEGVWQVVLHPDGKSFFTTNSDGKVRRWDIESGRVVSVFDTESQAMRMAIFPGSRRFIVVGQSGHASIWDIETGQRLKRLRPRLDDVYGVDVRADGERIATCGEKGAIVWATDDWSELLELKHKDDDVCTVRFSPDGSKIATCDDAGALRIFHGESGELIVAHKIGQSTKVLDWSPDGTRIAVSDADSGLAVFDIAKRDIVQTFKRKGPTYWPVLYPNEGAHALLGASNGLVGVSLESGQALSVAKESADERPNFAQLRVLCVNQAAGTLIAVDEEYSVHLVDARSGKIIRSEKPRFSDAKPSQAAASADGGLIAILHKPPMVDSDEDHLVFDEMLLEELEIEIDVEDIEPLDIGTVADAEIDADAKRIEVFRVVLDREIRSTENVFITIHNGGDLSLHKRIELAIGELESDESMRFVDGGSKLLVWLTSTHFQVWDAQSGKLHWEWEDDSQESYSNIYADRFSPYLLISDRERSRVLDLSSKSELGELRITRNEIVEAAFMPGTRGALLAEKSGEETRVYFWRGRTVENGASHSDEQLLRLIDQMGDPSFARREQAMESLIDQGSPVLVMLKEVAETDAEMSWRANQIRTEIRRAALPRSKAERQLTFSRPVSSIAITPDGTRFALIAGDDANAEICLGTISANGLELATRFTSGHSPEAIQFTSDSSVLQATLQATNGDGSVSLYRVLD